MSESGVEVFLVPAAWSITRMEAWEALCRARAVENQAYIIACNAVGERLLGHSMVVDPWGVKIASLGSGEGVLQTSLDLARLRTVPGGVPGVARALRESRGLSRAIGRQHPRLDPPSRGSPGGLDAE